MGGGVDNVPKVVRHFLLKYWLIFQCLDSKKLSHGCPQMADTKVSKMEGVGVNNVPKVVRHFLPKYWLIIQCLASKKLPYGCPQMADTKVYKMEGGRRSRPLLDNVENRDAFFLMSSLVGPPKNVFFVWQSPYILIFLLSMFISFIWKTDNGSGFVNMC